jgi:phosphoglycolate phosphatase-like HAD superfamily hydrolase
MDAEFDNDTLMGMRLILFDIDGTLISTAGAGMRAFCRAFQEIFGLPADRRFIRPDGKTDPLIAREFLAHFGREELLNPQSRRALFEAYMNALEEEMEKARISGMIRILPGVVDLLSHLANCREFAVGLATGNLESGARIKLGKAGIDRFFRFGGFGSDSEDRTTLIRVGIERGVNLVSPEPVEASIVIGDTPLDIMHGRAAGAAVIAVASARYSTEELAAHDPDLLVPDLSHLDAILSYLES